MPRLPYKSVKRQKLADARVPTAACFLQPPKPVDPPEFAFYDYNSVTPLDVTVAEVVTSSLKEFWMRPNGPEAGAKEALNEICIARSKVAKMIEAKTDDILFTISVFEGSKQIIMSAISRFKDLQKPESEKPHVIASSTEPLAIKTNLEKLREKKVIDVTYVSCYAGKGTITVKDVLAAIQPNTCLICISLANAFTGIMQPVENLGLALQRLERGLNMCQPSLYSDLSQVIGKLSVSVEDLNVDYATLDGSKIYGPGLSAMYFRNQLERQAAMFYKFKAEYGIIPGEENTAFIIGLGRAAELVSDGIGFSKSEFTSLKEYFDKRLGREFKDSIVMQHANFGAPTLPNTLCLSFKSKSDFKKLKSIGFLKTNLANAETKEFRDVLNACQISEELIPLTISISMGRKTKGNDITYFLDVLKKTLAN